MAVSVSATALAEDNENIFIVDEETGEVTVGQGEIVENPDDSVQTPSDDEDGNNESGNNDDDDNSSDRDDDDGERTYTSGNRNDRDDEDEEEDETTEESINPFVDVAEDAWYYDYILDVYEKGLMAGTGDEGFSPDSTLTRAMVTSIVYRMAGSPDVVYTAKFTDVPDGQWYTDGMLWASDNGVIAGYGNGLCGPNDPITVEQMAAILYRYAGSPDMSANTNVLSSYPDSASVSTYAADALKWAVVNGMTQGETLHPATSATRAEAAKMFSLF